MLKIKKKNTKFSILEIGQCSIDNIKNEVLNFSYQWEINESRQKTYKTHKDTKVYQLRDSSYYWNKGNPIEFKDINFFINNKSKEELLKIYKNIENLYNGTVIRSELVNMLANTKIKKHVDSGDSLYLGRRVHIPIITNKNVFFTVLNDTINMKEGYIYSII